MVARGAVQCVRIVRFSAMEQVRIVIEIVKIGTIDCFAQLDAVGTIMIRYEITDKGRAALRNLYTVKIEIDIRAYAEQDAEDKIRQGLSGIGMTYCKIEHIEKVAPPPEIPVR